MIITLSGIYFAFDASNLTILLLVSSPVLAFRHYYIGLRNASVTVIRKFDCPCLPSLPLTSGAELE